jgi:hypothetical protein
LFIDSRQNLTLQKATHNKAIQKINKLAGLASEYSIPNQDVEMDVEDS